MVELNGVLMDFDILEYLKIKNISYRLSGKNAMMCCPFHEEKVPSFGIHIETGVYHCFAGSCKAHGNIAQFIQKIEDLSSYESAEAWLKARFGTNTDDVNRPLILLFGRELDKPEVNYIPEETLKQWDYRHPYLEGRGIPDVWQRRFRVGYDSNADAITLPWFDRLGRCVGVKKRTVYSKLFWVYHLSSIGPNKITLFGINHVFRRRERRVIIVESEIDAIYLWSLGYPAVALGTAHITKSQLNELKNCPVEEVIIATDSDEAGQRIARDLAEKLNWIPSIRKVNWSAFPDVKDVNDLKPVQIDKLVGTSVQAETIWLID